MSGVTGASWVGFERIELEIADSVKQLPRIEVDLYTGFLRKVDGFDFSKNTRNDFLDIIGEGMPLSIALPQNVNSNIGRVTNQDIPNGLKYIWEIADNDGFPTISGSSIVSGDKGIHIIAPDIAGIYSLKMVFISDMGPSPSRVLYSETAGRRRGFIVPFIRTVGVINLTVYVTCGKAIIPEPSKVNDSVHIYWLKNSFGITEEAKVAAAKHISTFKDQERNISAKPATDSEIVLYNLSNAIYHKIGNNKLDDTDGKVTGLSAFRGYAQSVYSVLANLFGIRTINNSITFHIIHSFMMEKFVDSSIPLPPGANRPGKRCYNTFPYYKYYDNKNYINGKLPAEKSSPEEYIQFITIHDTGNPSSGANARSQAHYMTTNDAVNITPASWHYTVDDKKIFKSLPDDEMAWHAGEDPKLTTHAGNDNKPGTKKTMLDSAGYPLFGFLHSIAIEICVNKAEVNKNGKVVGGGYLLGATDNAAWLTAQLCEKHGILPSLDTIKTHNFWAAPYTDEAVKGQVKSCPRQLRGYNLKSDVHTETGACTPNPYGMDVFINRVRHFYSLAWDNNLGGVDLSNILLAAELVKSAKQYDDDWRENTVLSLVDKRL